MIQKKLLALLVLNFSICISFLYAQTVSGKVVDQDKKDISGVVVKVRNSSDSTFTKDDGYFKIQMDSTKSIIELQFIRDGKLISERTVKKVGNSEISLGEIKIAEPILLKEVTVRSDASFIQNKSDRIIFSLNGTMGRIAPDALTAFQYISDISIVEQKNIVAFGKGSVTVYLDDRELNLKGEHLIQFLSTLSSDEIDRIEYFPYPPSKYESSGGGGVINIILKKRVTKYALRSSLKQATYFGISNGATISVNKPKFSLTSTLDYNAGSVKNLEKGEIRFPDETWSFINNIRRKPNSLDGRLSTEFFMNPTNSIGINYIGKISKPTTNDNNITESSDFNEKNISKSLGDTEQSDNSNSLNLNYRYKFNSSKNYWNTDIDYFELSRSKFRRLYFGQDQHSEISTNNNLSINNYSLKSDITYTLGFLNLNVNSGMKYSVIKTENNSEFIMQSQPQNNEYIYNEEIFAIYTDFSRSIKKFQIRAGLRFERFFTKGVSNQNDYDAKNLNQKLFPTININYVLDKNNSLSFAFSKRIRRPNFSELDPFRWYINSYYYSEGNPFLKPSYSDNVEIGYRGRNKLNASIYYIHIKDGASQIPVASKEDKTIAFIRENYFENRMVGVNFGYRPKLFNVIESNNSLNVFYNTTDMIEKFNYIVPMNGFSSKISSYNTVAFKADKSFNIGCMLWYMTPSKTVLYRNSSTYNIDLTINKSFLKDKLQFTLSANDLFKSSVPTNETLGNSIYQKYYVYNDSRSLRLNIKYFFGNNKIKDIAGSSGNEAEVKRSF